MNLYVGNLLFDVGENDLRNAFEQFGQVDVFPEREFDLDAFPG